MENALAPGHIVDDRFEIIELIGHGGMGSVYRAIQLSLGRPIALKILRKDSAWSDSRNLTKRFLQEARLGASMSHRNIVTIFDYGFSNEEDLYFIVMELLAGENLWQRLVRVRRLAQVEALPLFIEIALGLRHLHQHGMVHRDLKPENIMLSRDPEEQHAVKLLDFGLVKPLQHNSQLTSVGTYIGSPCYMSPEQVNGEPPDPRSDIYSLGIALYQALCGQVPFRESTPIKTMMAQVSQPPPKLTEMYPECQISPELERLLYRMLEKDPAARPQNTDELLSSLRYLQAGKPIQETTIVRLPLAAQPPSLWVLSQDPSLHNQDVQEALSILEHELEISFIPTQESEQWVERLNKGLLLPPWIVLFGDMQILIEDPLLLSLRSVGVLHKLLISTHYNTEMLQHSVNFCGLDYHLALPASPQEIAEVVRQTISRVLLLRTRYSEFR
jgi:serine/threonine protein kinase